MKEPIGFSTTIPVEVLFAAGQVPVDLNNTFITAHDPLQFIRDAEEAGFPSNFCAWIKGTYSAAHHLGVKKIIIVQEGECTNAEKQAELFSEIGIQCIPFSYPSSRDKKSLKIEIEKLMCLFSVSWDVLDDINLRISSIRRKLQILDRMTHVDLTVSGLENFRWLLSSTDFNGDFIDYERRLDSFMQMASARTRKPENKRKRIGIIGIPPIVSDLFAIIDRLGGAVVFNEIPRQFSMPSFSSGILEQYRAFTYPYALQYRLDDILREVHERKIDGIIHYVQSFCPRCIDDIILKKRLTVPSLTIECDKPGRIDERNIIRLEAFFERWQ